MKYYVYFHNKYKKYTIDNILTKFRQDIDKILKKNTPKDQQLLLLEISPGTN